MEDQIRKLPPLKYHGLAKGNFRIGEGLVIDQTTSTIRGRDFNRAIQAQLTPLILALR